MFFLKIYAGLSHLLFLFNFKLYFLEYIFPVFTFSKVYDLHSACGVSSQESLSQFLF